MSCFATQPATRQALRGDDAGSVARFFKILVVNGFHHGVRDIQGGEVHQFKGAKLEAHLVTQYAVDGDKVRHTFADDAQCFSAVTATGVVDDEARRVLC